MEQKKNHKREPRTYYLGIFPVLRGRVQGYSTLRVQVPNNHILAQNLYYNTITQDPSSGPRGRCNQPMTPKSKTQKKDNRTSNAQQDIPAPSCHSNPCEPQSKFLRPLYNPYNTMTLPHTIPCIIHVKEFRP